MSDIVKVLRGKYALDYDEKTLDQFCNEAADEIEKLRAERDTLREALRAAKYLYLHGSTTSAFIEICAALGEKE